MVVVHLHQKEVCRVAVTRRPVVAGVTKGSLKM
jgi:hypothetical protein